MKRGVGIKRLFERMERFMEGWPDGLLTVWLLLAAALLVVIAFKGRAMEKAIAAAYVTFP